MTPNGQLGFNKSLGVWVKNHGGRNAMSAPSKHRRTPMIIKGIIEDYSMDKARIDAEGFDFIHKAEESPLCGMCGCVGDEYEKIDGIKVCEKCVKEVYESEG